MFPLRPPPHPPPPTSKPQEGMGGFAEVFWLIIDVCESREQNTHGPSRDSHLGNLPHVLNGGPFIGELGKCFLYLGNEAVDVDVGLGPALWEVKLRNAFTQRCGDGLLRPHLGLVVEGGNTRKQTVNSGAGEAVARADSASPATAVTTHGKEPLARWGGGRP